MVKEIDVGASQMGIEILTNKGSKDNPTKSVEIQKPPETPAWSHTPLISYLL